MDKEEIEELKDFTIDLTDIDELALSLEVCSKKSNMVIQEFADTIIQLQQENKQLKELIDTILNWNIFKNECPMNFGYDEETNENKAQDVFYKDDYYCENNCNDDYTKCWLKYFKRMHELEKGDSDEI